MTAQAAKAAILRTKKLNGGAAYIWGSVKSIDTVALRVGDHAPSMSCAWSDRGWLCWLDPLWQAVCGRPREGFDTKGGVLDSMLGGLVPVRLLPSHLTWFPWVRPGPRSAT